MADSIAVLGIEINTRDIKTAGAELDNLTAKATRTERATDKLGVSSGMATAGLAAQGRATAGTARATDQLTLSTGLATAETKLLTKATKGMTLAFAAFFGLRGVIALKNYADEFTNLQNKVRLVTDGTDELNSVTGSLFEVAKRSRTAIGATGDLYQKLAISTDTLGLSTKETLRLTETITKSFALTGASAAESAGAIRQLGQGLNAGALRGEEFNSVAEQAPLILRAIQNETKLTKAELREFAATGGITAAIVVSALKSIEDEVDTALTQSVKTFSQKITDINNKFAQWAGTSEKLATSLDVMAGSLSIAADATKVLFDNAGLLVAVLISRQLPAVIQLTSARVAATVATEQGIKAELAAATAAQKRALFELERAVATRQGTLADLAAEQAQLRNLKFQTERNFSLQRSIELSRLNAGATTLLTKATDAHSAALTRVTAAQSASNFVTRAGVAATGALNSVMGLLGGPAGIALLASFAFASYAKSVHAASEETARMRKEVELLENPLKNLTQKQLQNVATSNFEEITNVVKDLKEAQEEFRNVISSSAGGFRPGGSPFAGIQKGVIELTIELNKLGDESLRVAKLQNKLFELSLGKKLRDMASASSALTKNLEEQRDATRDILIALKEEFESLGRSAREQRTYSDQKEAGVTAQSAYGMAIKASVDVLMDEEDALAAAEAETKALAKAQKDAAKEAAKLDKVLQSQIEKTQSVVDGLAREVEALMESDREQALYNSLKEASTDVTTAAGMAIKESNDILFDHADALRDAAENATDFEKATEKAIRVAERDWRRAQRTLTGVFEGLLTSSENVFGQIFDSFKALLIKMIATAAANQVLLGVGFSGAPAALQAGSALAGASGGLGGLSGLSGLSGLGGLFTSQGAGGAAGAANASAIASGQDVLAQDFAFGETAFDTAAFSEGVVTFANGVETFAPFAAALGGALKGFDQSGIRGAATGAAGGFGGAKLGAAAGGKIGSIFSPVGGAIGAAIGAVVGGILGSELGANVFGGSFEARDFGLQLAVAAGDLVAESFSRESKKGGLFGSTERRTIIEDLDPVTTAGFSQVFNDVQAQIISSYSQLGIELGENVFEGFNFAAIQLSTKDKSAEKIAEEVDRFFTGIANQLTGFASDEITLSFQKINELAGGLTITNAILESFNGVLLETSIDGARAAQRLVEAAGGFDNLAGSASAFHAAFVETRSDSEITADALTSIFASVNQELPDTRDGFRDLVQGMDATTLAGANAIAILLALSPVVDEHFKGIAAIEKEALDARTLRIATAFSLQADIHELEGDALKALGIRREIELRTMDQALRPLQERIFALQDEADAAELAKEATKALAESQKELAAELAKSTDAAFNQLKTAVNAQKSLIKDQLRTDTTTERAAFDAIKNALRSAFENASDALESEFDLASTSLDSMFEASATSIAGSIDTVSESVATLSNLSGALGNTLNRLRLEDSTLDLGRRRAAQSQISGALSQARGGAFIDLSSIEPALAEIARPSADLFSTFEEYATDFAKTSRDIEALQSLTDSELTLQERTLAALESRQELERTNFEASQDLLRDNFDASEESLRHALESDLTLAQTHHDKAIETLNTIADAELLALDTLLGEQSTLVDILRGTETATLSVAEAVNGLAVAIALERVTSGLSVVNQGGGLRLVEQASSPQLQSTGPSNVVSNSSPDSAEMVAASNKQTKEIIDQLVVLTKTQADAIVVLEDTLENWEQNGMPPVRAVI